MNRLMKARFGIFVVMLLLMPLAFSLSKAHADTITFNMNTVYSGGTPSGSAPWATATISDTGTNTVTLTMDNLLSSPQFISDWYFNLDPAEVGSVTGSDFNYKSGFAANSTQVGEDGFKADGGGYYDIDINWLTSQGNRFVGGDKAVYTITASGLDAQDFLYLSTQSGGHGTHYSAIHVQGIPPCGDSAWVGSDKANVPEPGTMALFGMGLALAGALSFVRRKRVKNCKSR